MLYFIGRKGQQLGPFTEQQIREQLAAGLTGPTDLFWCEGMSDWQPVRTRFDQIGTPPPLPPARPPSSFSPGPGLALGQGPKLASREARLLATSIDHLFAIALTLPGLIHITRALAEPLQDDSLQPESSPDVNKLTAQLHAIVLSSLPLLALALLILTAVQFALLTRRGQTLGKLFCKIRIVRTGGERAGFVHVCLLRTLSMGLIAAIPFVGWLIASVDPFLIFREDRRCLHDLLADTTVIEA